MEDVLSPPEHCTSILPEQALAAEHSSHHLHGQGSYQQFQLTSHGNEEHLCFL